MKKEAGQGIYIFCEEKHEKASFHDIAVEKSNSVICHIPDTRPIPGDVMIALAYKACATRRVT
jgi:hypothetical protein